MIKQQALFSQRLKQARLEMDIKQQHVAAYLQIPISAVSAFESAKRRLGAVELYQLSKLYCKPIGWFFEGRIAKHSDPLLRATPDNAQRHDPLMFEDPMILECLMLLKQAPVKIRSQAVRQVHQVLRDYKDNPD